MKTLYIWKRCFLKEVKIPEPWYNKDALVIEPARQDIFWVEMTKKEYTENILPIMTNEHHRNRMMDMITWNASSIFHFMISRNLSYIQYYPFFNLSAEGSLWEKITETTFNKLQHLDLLAR